MAYPKDCVTDEQKKAFNKAHYAKYRETSIRCSTERYHNNREEILKKQKEALDADPERRARKNAVTKMWHAENRDYINAKNREKYAENPEPTRLATRKSKLKIKYGLTEEAHDAMLASQGGCCAICKTFRWGSTSGVPHVDHDHETGEVRGLLCFACNTGLGKLGDNVESLERALAYLKKAR